MTDAASLAASAWSRYRSRGPLEMVIWAVAVVCWSWLLIETGGDLFRISAWSVPFLLMIAVVTVPWRTVSWRQLGGFFMLGMGPVFLLAVLSQYALDGSFIEGWVESVLDSLAESGNDLRIVNIRQDLWAPITEELLKVAPLLGFVWWKRSGLRTVAGPIDYAVLGGAAGAGLAFSEDILVHLHQGLPGPPSNSFALGVGQFYRDIVGADPSGGFTGRSGFADNMSFFYPEMQDIFGVVWSGHGAYAFGLGLAIGVAVWGARRWTRAAYLIPVVVYGWVVWEHVMANWYGGAACARRDSPLCTVASIDLRGRVFPVLLLIGFAAVAYWCRAIIRTKRATDSALVLSSQDVDRSGYAADGWRGSIASVRDRLDFWRWRRKAFYGDFRLEDERWTGSTELLMILACRTRAAAVRQRLIGGEPVPIPETTAHQLADAMPMS